MQTGALTTHDTTRERHKKKKKTRGMYQWHDTVYRQCLKSALHTHTHTHTMPKYLVHYRGKTPYVSFLAEQIIGKFCHMVFQKRFHICNFQRKPWLLGGQLVIHSPPNHGCSTWFMTGSRFIVCHATPHGASDAALGPF